MIITKDNIKIIIMIIIHDKMIIHNTPPWTMCHIDTFGHLATASLKTLSRKNPVGQKTDHKEKIVQCTSSPYCSP